MQEIEGFITFHWGDLSGEPVEYTSFDDRKKSIEDMKRIGASGWTISPKIESFVTIKSD